MTERDKKVLREARKLRVQVVGEEIDLNEDGFDLNLDLEEGNEVQGTMIKVVSKNEIDEEEFKQLFDVNIYLTDILQNEFLCYCFESEEEIELTPHMKEKLLKFAKNNKARIMINDEIIYDFIGKEIVSKVANELKKFEIIVWTDKVPVQYEYKDIVVKVNEDGSISYSGPLRRITNAGNDFFILDVDAPYYVIEENDKVYLLLGQNFRNKAEFTEFVNQMLSKKWKDAKLLRKTEIKLKNAKIILCFYQYKDKKFISILSSKNSFYRGII